MPYISRQGVHLYYEVHGQGPKVLFLSGTGGDLRIRPSVFDRPLAKHFEVLALDQRGLGQSDKPAGPYTMHDYAADAKSLLDELAWTRVGVVGISFGGMVAQELALAHPERISRLVIGVSSSGGQGGASYPLHEVFHLPAHQYARRVFQLADARIDDQWLDANRTLVDLRAAHAPEMLDPDARRGLAEQLGARSHHDTFDRLPQLTVPTYVFGGVHDRIAPPDNLTALASRIPGAALDIFNHGHFSWNEDAAVWDRIIRFLTTDNTTN